MLKSKPHRRQGMSLPELLVSMALFSVISLVTMQLYMSAYTEFDHSSGTMTLNQRARVVIDRITQTLKTAVPVLNVNTEAFIHPNAAVDFNKEMYETDFMSTICFMPNPTLGSTWQITDQASAGYVQDPTDPRFIYETDMGLTSLVTRQPSLYRYRIAWNNLTTTLATKGRSVPARAVYMERQTFGTGGADANAPFFGAAGPNTAALSYVNQWIADTGTPYANMKARILGRNIHYLTFTRTQGNVVLLRMKMYNRDPVTGAVVEGSTMRRPTFGGTRDPNNPSGVRSYVVDLVTNIQLPNTF